MDALVIGADTPFRRALFRGGIVPAVGASDLIGAFRPIYVGGSGCSSFLALFACAFAEDERPLIGGIETLQKGTKGVHSLFVSEPGTHQVFDNIPGAVLEQLGVRTIVCERRHRDQKKDGQEDGFRHLHGPFPVDLVIPSPINPDA